MTVMARLDMRIGNMNNAIASFCERWHVAQLAVFGSSVREDFNEESDIDVLVSFAAGHRYRFADLDEMEAELATLMGRRVDVVDRAAVEASENFIRRETILAEAEVVYAAG